jgi:hypothetical protein
MFKRFKRFIKEKSRQVSQIDNLYAQFSNDLKNPKVNLGQIQAYLNNQRSAYKSLHELEFQVYSQWGDDGIIQYLVNRINVPNKIFVEFGVENYKESNTRFLLINNNWSGLVIDGSAENIEYIRNDIISWAYDIHAVHSFITKENINGIIRDFLSKGYESEIGILSIDIDGNDYWIWNEINVVNPVIVILEYNAVFGAEKKWTIPYQADFYRLDVHKSYQYWGASLKAFCQLGESKGYAFIGCNSNGNNAYFIRKDQLGSLRPVSCEEGFVDSKFREYVDDNGERVGGKKRLDLIKGMPIFNLETGEVEKI